MPRTRCVKNKTNRLLQRSPMRKCEEQNDAARGEAGRFRCSSPLPLLPRRFVLHVSALGFFEIPYSTGWARSEVGRGGHRVFASRQPVEVVLFFTHPVRGILGIPYLQSIAEFPFIRQRQRRHAPNSSRPPPPRGVHVFMGQGIPEIARTK